MKTYFYNIFIIIISALVLSVQAQNSRNSIKKKNHDVALKDDTEDVYKIDTRTRLNTATYPITTISYDVGNIRSILGSGHNVYRESDGTIHVAG